MGLVIKNYLFARKQFFLESRFFLNKLLKNKLFSDVW